MRKVKFGISQLKKPTPKWVGMLIKVVKRICMTVAGASIINEHPYVALAFLVVGGIADEIQPFFGIEKEASDEHNQEF